jgi:hypothetical protein
MGNNSDKIGKIYVLFDEGVCELAQAASELDLHFESSKSDSESETLFIEVIGAWQE